MGSVFHNLRPREADSEEWTDLDDEDRLLTDGKGWVEAERRGKRRQRAGEGRLGRVEEEAHALVLVSVEEWDRRERLAVGVRVEGRESISSEAG
jgi:hypothetical protein